MDLQQQVNDLRDAVRGLLDVRHLSRQRDTGVLLKIQVAGRDLLGVERTRDLPCIGVGRQHERHAQQRTCDWMRLQPRVDADRVDQRGEMGSIAAQCDAFSSNRRPAVDREQSEAVD